MEQNKAERLNENVTEKMCSSDGNVVGEMCSPADADTYRDNSCTTSDRYVKILDFRHLRGFSGLTRVTEKCTKRQFLIG